MSYLCPHLLEQYFQKVTEIVIAYKPQIVFLVAYKDVSEGLILRSVVRKEEHEIIIKLRSPQKQVERLLTIIPQRMWGLENFMTCIIDANVDAWLAEELFQAYIRHLVNSIKKQQAERKCACLKSTDSIFRRRWIQLLKILDTWIFSVGTSLGFLSQTLYPVSNSLSFINDRLPIPRRNNNRFQLQGTYSAQSVVVTEVEDDETSEQNVTNQSSPYRFNSILPRVASSRPVRAITNGLILTPLKALNTSLSHSVDRISNLTNPDLQSKPAVPMITYPTDDITTATQTIALKPKILSTSSPINSSSVNSSIINSPKASTASLASVATILKKSPNAAVPVASTGRVPVKSVTSSDASTLSNVTKPSRPLSVSSESFPTAKERKSSLSSDKLLKSTSPLTKSTPSLLKLSQAATQETSTFEVPPEYKIRPKKFTGERPASVTFSSSTESIELEPPISVPISTRSIGTNTVFHFDVIEQPAKLKVTDDTLATDDGTVDSPGIPLSTVESTVATKAVSNGRMTSANSPTIIQSTGNVNSTTMVTANAGSAAVEDSLLSFLESASLSLHSSSTDTLETVIPKPHPEATKSNGDVILGSGVEVNTCSVEPPVTSAENAKTQSPPKSHAKIVKPRSNSTTEVASTTETKDTVPAAKKIPKQSMSNLFDRLSKPKTPITETREKNKSSNDQISPNTTTKMKPSFKKQVLKVLNTINDNVNSDEMANYIMDTNGISNLKKKVIKKSATRPGFNASTRVKAPAPLPSVIYDRLSPEDYNFQQWSNAWACKNQKKDDETIALEESN